MVNRLFFFEKYKSSIITRLHYIKPSNPLNNFSTPLSRLTHTILCCPILFYARFIYLYISSPFALTYIYIYIYSFLSVFFLFRAIYPLSARWLGLINLTLIYDTASARQSLISMRAIFANFLNASTQYLITESLS